MSNIGVNSATRLTILLPKTHQETLSNIGIWILSHGVSPAVRKVETCKKGKLRKYFHQIFSSIMNPFTSKRLGDLRKRRNHFLKVKFCNCFYYVFSCFKFYLTHIFDSNENIFVINIVILLVFRPFLSISRLIYQRN